MKRLAKGAARRLRRVLPRKSRPAILMYHRIAMETFDPWGLAVEEQRFADQLEWLSRNRQVMPLDEFAEHQRKDRLPPTAVALTFDDGYACSLRANTHLQRLDLPATIFIAPELIQRRREFWWDELAGMVLKFDGDLLHLDGEDIQVPDTTERDEIWRPGAPPATARQSLFHTLWANLRTKRPADLNSAMAELRDQSGKSGPRDSHRPLTAEEVRSLNATTISFGSHAMTHPSLPALGNEEKAVEIADSRSRCAEMTGRDPAAFAYPYGDMDAESRRLVRDAGFDCACSTKGEFVNRWSNPFALPRLQVGNWDLPKFTAMLGGQ